LLAETINMLRTDRRADDGLSTFIATPKGEERKNLPFRCRSLEYVSDWAPARSTNLQRAGQKSPEIMGIGIASLEKQSGKNYLLTRE
jgi:hypothetical protein